jgi:hypothetical protein
MNHADISCFKKNCLHVVLRSAHGRLFRIRKTLKSTVIILGNMLAKTKISCEHDEKSSNSGYIEKAGQAGFPEGLIVGISERHQVLPPGF